MYPEGDDDEWTKEGKRVGDPSREHPGHGSRGKDLDWLLLLWGYWENPKPVCKARGLEVKAAVIRCSSNSFTSSSELSSAEL